MMKRSRKSGRMAAAGMFVWGIMHANSPTATRLSHHQILKHVKMLMSTQSAESPPPTSPTSPSLTVKSKICPAGRCAEPRPPTLQDSFTVSISNSLTADRQTDRQRGYSPDLPLSVVRKAAALRSTRAVTSFGLVERDEHRRFAEGTSWWWSSYPHLSSISSISSILSQLPPEAPVRKCGRRGWSLRRQSLFFFFFFSFLFFFLLLLLHGDDADVGALSLSLSLFCVSLCLSLPLSLSAGAGSPHHDSERRLVFHR